ncbi:hypothetical protein BJ878DRAFT_545790 [Calycina marina]|uniref:Uncharacterized protein n=1 Tax=Calycina marina TaxID=1763456 RepID=A0A9P8CD35_9HELO|nr:hypothetical protein BJ878DRAFT_545790 [Calycina marina]
MVTLRTAVLVVLPVLLILGAHCTYGIGAKNGHFKEIFELVSADDALFPGSNSPLLRRYTGFERIDHQLQVLVTFFSPVVDAENRDLMLFCIFGAGQFGGAWTLMMMESFRLGNTGRLVSYIGIVGVLVQNIAFTVAVPLYLFLHLLTSPTANLYRYNTHLLLVQALDLKILPLTIFLGYVVPSTLIALPIFSSAVHQQLIAFWQLFPVWAVVIHSIIRFPMANSATGDSRTLSRSQAQYDRDSSELRGPPYLERAGTLYQFVLAICHATHLPILAITLLPSTSFAGGSPTVTHLLQSDFVNVFIPYRMGVIHKVSGLAEGALAFLQWDIYIGSAALLLWALVVYQNATRESMKPFSIKARWLKLAWEIPVYFIASGPVGALTVVLWERDLAVRFDQEKKIRD